jgi:hypothetical protein
MGVWIRPELVLEAPLEVRDEAVDAVLSVEHLQIVAQRLHKVHVVINNIISIR